MKKVLLKKFTFESDETIISGIQRFSSKNVIELLDFLRSLISPYLKTSSIVLDAGCGYRNYLINKNNVRVLIGTDFDEEALKNNKEISYSLMANIEQLCFKKKSIDLIMSHNVLEHIENPDHFVSSVSHTLKPGGQFLLITPNKISVFGVLSSMLPNKWLKFLSFIITGKKIKNEVHYYRMNHVNIIKKTLEENNFKKINIVLMNYFPNNKLMRRACLFDYFIGKSGLIKNYSMIIICLAELKS